MAFGRTTTMVARLFSLTVMSLTVSGCLDSHKTAEPDTTAEQLTLSGSVGDGPVVNADMRVLGADDSVLVSFVSDANAHYEITFDVAVDQFPLKIDATSGTDLVTMRAPDFRFESVVLSGDDPSVVNLNPFSTLITALAANLPGGLNASNVEAAERTVVSEMNSGLETFASSGVVQTPVVDSNIAEIVKASETLAEMIRRTSNRMNDAGFPVTADEFISAVASDLSDGVMDGLGGNVADPRLSAIATIVYAQVLMEAMANDLHVLGANAEDAMNSAIQQVGNSPEKLVGNLTLTADMVRKARVGLAAAYEVTADPAIRDLHAIVSGFAAGTDPTTVRFLLPANYRFAMSSLIANIGSADFTTIDTVNRVARGDGSLAPANSAPVISGSPPGSVETGQSYSFTPTASDPDGDTLTFSVANLPSWAGFDSATGAISGTPGDSDAGDYAGIVITVSDGSLSDTLGPFSITVTDTPAPPPANSAPVISGSPPGSVETGQSYSFTPTASDPDGDTLTFSVANLPSWAGFDSATGAISGTPGDSDAGDYAGIVITVSDGSLSDTLGPFSITVTDTPAPPPANSPPVISGSPPSSVTVGQSYAFTPDASDPDGDTLTFSVANLPSWAGFDSATGTISGAPGDGDVGDYPGIRLTVTDGTDSASIEFQITVEAISLGSITLSWTPPTRNTDGSPLTDLAGYRFYWGTTPGIYTNSETVDNPGLSSYVLENLAPGTYEFVVTAVNSEGTESPLSEPAAGTVQ